MWSSPLHLLLGPDAALTFLEHSAVIVRACGTGPRRLRGSRRSARWWRATARCQRGMPCGACSSGSAWARAATSWTRRGRQGSTQRSPRSRPRRGATLGGRDALACPFSARTAGAEDRPGRSQGAAAGRGRGIAPARRVVAGPDGRRGRAVPGTDGLVLARPLRRQRAEGAPPAPDATLLTRVLGADPEPVLGKGRAELPLFAFA
jgi:hypothetical protein